MWIDEEWYFCVSEEIRTPRNEPKQNGFLLLDYDINFITHRYKTDLNTWKFIEVKEDHKDIKDESKDNTLW